MAPGRRNDVYDMEVDEDETKQDKQKQKQELEQRDEAVDEEDREEDDDDDEAKFEFNKLVNHRWDGNQIEVEVEWKREPNSWEPEANLHRDAPQALFSYWKRIGERPPNPNDPELYDIFAIQKHSKDRKQLLVEWTGYSPKEATWVPRAVVEATAPVVVRNYMAKLPKAKGRGRPAKAQGKRRGRQAK